MNFRVFVISLPQAHERRRLVGALLQSQHIEFEFIDGIEAASLGLDYLAEVRALRMQHLPAERDLTRGEIACALSHRLAYQQIAHRGLDGALILEDDVEVSAEFALFVDQLKLRRLPLTWKQGVVLLGGFDEYAPSRDIVSSVWLRWRISPKTQIRKTILSGSNVTRACCYFVGCAAAARINVVDAHPLQPADAWQYMMDRDAVQSLCIAQPFMATHPANLEGQSTLEQDRYMSYQQHELARHPPRPRRPKPFDGLRVRYTRPLRRAIRQHSRKLLALLP